MSLEQYGQPLTDFISHQCDKANTHISSLIGELEERYQELEDLGIIDPAFLEELSEHIETLQGIEYELETFVVRKD